MDIDLTLVGKIVGSVFVLAQAIKMAGIKGKFIPLIAIALGIGASFLFGGVAWSSLALGVVLGLGTTLGFREVKESIS